VRGRCGRQPAPNPIDKEKQIDNEKVDLGKHTAPGIPKYKAAPMPNMASYFSFRFQPTAGSE
jgi:hypothetical protein